MQVNLVNTIAIVGVEALTLFIKKAVPQTVIKAEINLSKVNNPTLNFTQVFKTMSIVGLTSVPLNFVVNTVVIQYSAKRYFGCWLTFEGSIVDMQYTIGII